MRRIVHRRLLVTLLVLAADGSAQNPPPSVTTIYNFIGGSDGESPGAPLIIGSGGVLYGTTQNGGTGNVGTVFSLTPPAVPGGAWTHTVLYSFQDSSSDGGRPNTRLIIGSGGVLYRTTYGGGSLGYGTVFSLTPPQSPGGAWTEAMIHSFGSSNPDGKNSGWFDDGQLYGVLVGATRSGGGNSDDGSVFALHVARLSPAPLWTERTLYGFKNLSDGWLPGGGVTIGSGGCSTELPS